MRFCERVSVLGVASETGSRIFDVINVTVFSGCNSMVL